MAAPKLRFKDIEGCEFPKWETHKLGNICKFFSGGTPSSKNKSFYNGNIPFIRSAEIYGDHTELFLTEAGLKSSSAKLVNIGDILYALYGANSGEVAISKINGAINQAILCIRPDSMNKEYLCNYLYFKKGKIVTTLLQGGQGNLSGELVKSIHVPVPALPEQQKIADFLSTYDRMIDIQSQRVEAMRTRKKGLLQKIFSREIRFKDDQGKDYPAWKEIKLGSIVHRVTRKNRNLITKRPLTISAELGLIDQEEFFSKKIASDNLSNYYLLHKGEFAFNRSSATGYPFGAIKRLNRYESGAISTLYICFSVDNSDYSDWLQHFFESTYWHKEAYKVCCEGARNHGLLNISVDDFFSMKLYLPTLPEQQKIADFLTAIDTQIEVEEKRLETMKTIKKGLLQQMFI